MMIAFRVGALLRCYRPLVAFRWEQLSSVQNPGWLGYIGDEILPSYIPGLWYINYPVIYGLFHKP